MAAPLQDLILEFDREKVLERIQKVEETLIFEPTQQLRQGSDGHSERDAINDALYFNSASFIVCLLL